MTQGSTLAPLRREPTESVVPRGIWAGRVTLSAGWLTVLLFGVLAFQRRWIGDDGMIVVRVVRQILAGAGPNYNPFERVEAATSPLWVWLLAAFAYVRPGDVAAAAVALGLVLSIAGMGAGLAGCVRLHRARGEIGVLVPLGALVPLAVGGFWDYATSGLETGLSLCWFGYVWWLLVSINERSGPGRVLATAVVIGAGPLIRPDFLLASVVFGAAALLLTRPGWRRGLGYCGVGLVLPVGYEIFRAGYYGILVPLPAVAKEASSARWGQGVSYLNDFVDAYLLWIPLLMIAVIGTRLLDRIAIDRRTAVLLATPVLAAVCLGIYLVRVGGDYMHARLWVPVLFALLLPVLMAPLGRRRLESTGAALLAVWALIAGLFLGPPYHGTQFGPTGLTDERDYETVAFADPHPSAESRRKDTTLIATLAALTDHRDRTLVLRTGTAADGNLWTIPLAPSLPDRGGYFYNNMGIAAAVMPLQGTVIDVNGLATPLAGHLQLEQRARPGHEKWLPAAWVLARYADPAAIAMLPDTPDATKAQVYAARDALSCGRLAELVDSTSRPLTPERFWANLTGALSRTGLRIPQDPFAAKQRFCR
ncbi:hypothetical protein NDR87_35830 [Nocardia sp. CDC159]|uniref:Terminal beta-(1->2)-arabinofuranosyltransferase C-terminal domain-containing protein n=1 Tax=Nocardia pulmonis TaxID=2951408 RepID=A0A9X2EIH9_9NOCA|nr:MULTISPECIES: hypothetical protein [Nocardia]MCM6778858.1 hypothetical protein [Nocardia pulmonis]MCM6791747.1 hypothetical protein [Nocardia sp. CDC159]